MTKTRIKTKEVLDIMYCLLIMVANGGLPLITVAGYIWFVNNFLFTKIECDFREGILIATIFSAWLFLGLVSCLALFFEAIRLMSEETKEEFWERKFDRL